MVVSFRFIRRVVLSSCLWLLAATAAAGGVTVTINKPRNDSTYMFDLMKLALTYSSTTYSYATSAETLAKGAQTEAVKSGELAVMWAGTSEQMERDFIPVRIDGYRGLMSLRFLIIRDGEQARFNRIHTLADLERVKFGQGRSWQDALILEHSGLRVEKATKKESLFYMLDGGRFDAFPRGATEAWQEASAHPQLDLSVETGLIIAYPLPTYFFVHKGYPQLAADIEAGLEQALVDGSFEEYFYKNDRVIEFLKNAKLDQRRVIEIANPFLPKATPLHRKELFPNIEDLVAGAQRYSVAAQ